jgi:WD40 repeat protein
MSRRASAALGLLLCLAGVVPPSARAAGEDETPILRLEPGGPTARVHTLAFSPDGRTLYAAGLDKVVHVWTRNGQGGPFVPAPVAYRVPVGAGTTGAINCLAASPDGRWLAASGIGLTELEADFRTSGRVFQIYLAGPKFFQERSLIYVFPVGPGPARDADVRVLRGHEGPVLALAFAPADRGQQGPPLLVSAARDRWGPGPWRGDVRVWDVGRTDGDAQVAQLSLPQIGLTDRPGLAVRRAGGGPKPLHVALAWGDGRLRVWDAASGQEPRSVRDGRDPVNQTVAYLPPVDGGPAELLTGSYGNAGGQLQRWSDPPAADPAATLSLERLEDRKSYPVPRALALASSGAGHGLDLAALVVRPAAGEGPFRLWLVDPSANRAAARPLPLWGGRRDPVLVGSPDGRFLAIAHSDRPEVLIYPVEGLLSGNARPQVLRGLGATVKSVAFARRAREPVPGLLLDVTAPDGNGPGAARSVIFDFAGRKILTSRQAREEWRALRPAAESAVEDVTPPGQALSRVFAWRQGGQERRVTVPLNLGEEVTAVTLVPPRAGAAAVPVLAVAAYNRLTAEPRLVLYDALAGVQFRQLFGHAALIHSLAATPDGKLLASAAEDQLVCLWGLTDLDTILHKHGTLEGVLFRQGEDGAVVQKVDPKANTGLEVGDRVTGVTLEGDKEPRPVHAVLDLYNAVWRGAEPGGRVRLRLERAGKRREATVEAGQGVEARTPLLSLFLTGGTGGEPGWIAWTPSGNFDASGPDVEQYVGWQFNPARPGVQRIRFAPLNDYRDRFYEKLLLKHLVASASLDRARAEIARLRAIPRPEVSIDFAGSDRAAKGAGGTFVVHEPGVRLRLTVDGPSLQKGEVAAVLVETGGRTESLDLTRAAGRTLTYPVTLPPRDSRRFTVTVRTPENLGEATADVTLRFQPPPPVIELADLPEERTEVRDAVLNLRARLRPGTPGQGVRWSSLRLNGKRLPVPAGPDAATPLTLNPGENLLELAAVNADAPEADAAAETARATRVLVFEKEETPQPRFTQLELLAKGAARPRREAAKASDLVVLDTPRVRLLGTVTARQPLARVLLRVGAAAPVAAEGKLAGKTFELDHALALEPRQELTVVLEARTEKSDWGKASLRLRYDPPLPEIDLVEPEANKVILDRQHRGFAELDVTGLLRPAADFYPFEVRIWVSGKGKAGPAELARKPDVVTRFQREADLPADGKPAGLGRIPRLGSGSSRVQVQVANGARTGEPLVRYVTYRQPPRIVGALQVPPTVRKPFARVEARVESPSDLPLTGVVVNGKRYAAGDVATPADGPRAGLSSWVVRVDEVPLGDQGKNPVRLEVRNADGADEATADVQVMQEPPQKARVEVLNLPPEGNVPHAHFDLDVRVESVSELRGLRLRRGAESRDLRAADAAARPQGYYEWRKKVPIDLTEGDNPLAIEAENAGGVKAESVKLTYVPLPVRLLLVQPDAAVRDARLELHGKVAWRDPGQARRVIDQLGQVRVYVNDHLQAPPRARPRDPDAKEQAFVVDLLLNQRDNDIQVECPFPLEYESQRSTHVVCEKPVAPGTLRVLLVNAGEQAIPDEVFVKRALDALQVEGEGTELRSRAFGHVALYPYPTDQPVPLAGRVTRDKVKYWLGEIRRDIERGAATRQGRPSDVVLVYWLGKDLLQDEKGDWYLPTSDTAREPRKSPSVTGQPLAALLDVDRDVPGARLLLLDLAGPKAGEESAADWPPSRAAVLRYLWTGDAIPVPGLIEALQTAARGKEPVSVQAWDRAADRLTAPLRKQYRAAVHLTERLPASLSSLVVARPAPP